MCQYLVIFQKMYEKIPNFMVVFLFCPLYCWLFFPMQKKNVTDLPTSDQWMDLLCSSSKMLLNVLQELDKYQSF